MSLSVDQPFPNSRFMLPIIHDSSDAYFGLLSRFVREGDESLPSPYFCNQLQLHSFWMIKFNSHNVIAGQLDSSLGLGNVPWTLQSGNLNHRFTCPRIGITDCPSLSLSAQASAEQSWTIVHQEGPRLQGGIRDLCEGLAGMHPKDIQFIQCLQKAINKGSRSHPSQLHLHSTWMYFVWKEDVY